MSGAAPTDNAGSQSRLGSVQKRKTLFCLQLQRRHPESFHRFAPRNPGRSGEDFAFTNEDQSEMRQGSKISACAHAAAAGNHGIQMMVEQIAEALGNHGSHPGQAFCKNVGAQKDQSAHFVFTKRLADSRCVAAQEIVLQL